MSTPLSDLEDGYRPAFNMIMRVVEIQKGSAFIANVFGVSLGTARRWCSGVSSPHPLMGAITMKTLDTNEVDTSLAAIAWRGISLDLVKHSAKDTKDGK